MSTPAAPPRRYFAWLIVLGCIVLASYSYVHDNEFGLIYSLIILTQITAHVMLRSWQVDGLIWVILFLSIFLYPAIAATIDSGRRMHRSTRIREVLLGFQAYEQEHSQLPSLGIQGKDGQPLLSWRVKLLPYLGHESLYREFKLDEPWSSEHNMRLLPKMPMCYHPLHWRTISGFTHLVALTGPGSVFAEPGVTRAKVDAADGSHITTILAESARLIPWTMPEDEDFSPNKTPPSLMAYPNSRSPTIVGMLGGSTWSLNPRAVHRLDQIRKLITWKGNELIEDGVID